jgi:hypothetical protein
MEYVVMASKNASPKVCQAREANLNLADICHNGTRLSYTASLNGFGAVNPGADLAFFHAGGVCVSFLLLRSPSELP